MKILNKRKHELSNIESQIYCQQQLLGIYEKKLLFLEYPAYPAYPGQWQNQHGCDLAAGQLAGYGIQRVLRPADFAIAKKVYGEFSSL